VWSLTANKKFAGKFSGNGLLHSVLDIQHIHRELIISSAPAFVNNQFYPYLSRLSNHYQQPTKNPPK